MHNLLDDYTASFTLSETPFAAWVNVAQRRYEWHASPGSFIRDAVFLAAWFAYSDVQEMGGNMSCPSCGPTPENVIWDSVSLAFYRKHIPPSLRPPIMVNENSLERQSKHISQSLVQSAEVRRNRCKVIEANWAPTDSENATPSFQQLTEWFGLIQSTVGALREIKQELGDYFNNHYGIEMLASEKKPSTEVAQLFGRYDIVLSNHPSDSKMGSGDRSGWLHSTNGDDRLKKTSRGFHWKSLTENSITSCSHSRPLPCSHLWKSSSWTMLHNADRNLQMDSRWS